MNNFKSGKQVLSEPAAGHHIAHLYGDDQQLIETVSFFVREVLRRNEAIILLATSEHWSGVVACLERDADIDLVSAVLRIHVEIVDILWWQGRHSAARRIEEFWNAIARQHRFSLLCTYGIDKQGACSVDATLKYVCATHSHLVHAFSAKYRPEFG